MQTNSVLKSLAASSRLPVSMSGQVMPDLRMMVWPVYSGSNISHSSPDVNRIIRSALVMFLDMADADWDE